MARSNLLSSVAWVNSLTFDSSHSARSLVYLRLLNRCDVCDKDELLGRRVADAVFVCQAL